MSELGAPSDSAGVKTETTTASTVAVQGLLETGSSRNAGTVVCLRCPSIVLRPHLGTYTSIQLALPPMHVKSEEPSGGSGADQQLDQFWAVDDIYTFENMGFSNTVNGNKYLVCADCEIGPIGFHNLSTKVSYVALDRVRHLP